MRMTAWGRNIFGFFQTAETGNRTPNSGVKGGGAPTYIQSKQSYHDLPGSMLVHRLRQWTSTEPARYTGAGSVNPNLRAGCTSHYRVNKYNWSLYRVVNPCSAVELKLAQRPNKLRPASRTQPRKHDTSKQCCFKAGPPSTTLAQH